jgi:CubicO group peptidase (beta-lactamase class C family)
MTAPSSRRVGCALLLILFAPGFVRADESAPPKAAPFKPPAEAWAKAREYMAARVRVNQFSGAVLVAVDGNPLFRDGFGLANHDFDAPNTPATKFRIGSVTKQFTAVAVLLLVQQGKLALSDPIGKHLPECPKAWADVTVHQLLSHTGGIPEHTTLAFVYKKENFARSYTPQAIVDLVKDKGLDFTPGEDWKYSNTGYILLGQLIEAVSGKGYGQFMRESVFAPLGMADSGYEQTGEVLKGRATGYTRSGEKLTAATYIHMSLPYAAGSLYSTADDLLVWDRALANHKLLGPSATEKLFAPVRNDYACGFDIHKRFGRTVQEHGGGIPGFVSYVGRYPEADVFVAVLTNVEGLPVGAVANELAAIALGENYELPRERKAGKADPETFAGYVGEYRREKETLTVARDGDALEYRIGKGSASTLVFESPGRYFVRSRTNETDLRFVADEPGKVTHLLLRRNGVETKWEKSAEK